MAATLPAFTWRQVVLVAARTLRFVREEPDNSNDGAGVRFIQKATGNEPPAYWCASYVVRVLVEALGRALAARLVPLSASCDDLLARFRARGALLTAVQMRTRLGLHAPETWAQLFVPVVFFVLASDADATHTGFVVEWLADGFVTIEGNAADPRVGASRNGNGVYEGRVRGNRAPVTYGGRTWPADRRRYAFGDLDALAAATP